MRESRTYGFVRGAHSDMRPYRDPYLPPYLPPHGRVPGVAYKYTAPARGAAVPMMSLFYYLPGRQTAMLRRYESPAYFAKNYP
jgi:hypothetical protein